VNVVLVGAPVMVYVPLNLGSPILTVTESPAFRSCAADVVSVATPELPCLFVTVYVATGAVWLYKHVSAPTAVTLYVPLNLGSPMLTVTELPTVM
jgi:hypothetical protein